MGIRYELRGRGAVVWVTTIAVIATPTVAELSAGIPLHPHMVNDGLDTPLTAKLIDASDAADRFNKTEIGSFGGDPGSFTGYKYAKGSDDIAWNTLDAGSRGFLVIAPTGWAQDPTTGLGTPGGTPTVGDRCEVWPAAVSIRARQKPADQQLTRFMSSIAFPSAPEQDALVAA